MRGDAEVYCENIMKYQEMESVTNEMLKIHKNLKNKNDVISHPILDIQCIEKEV